MFFSKKNNAPNNAKVAEIKLSKEYPFQYEHFIIADSQELFLFLEENDGIIDALKFNPTIYKYGHPNDEVGHPLYQSGLKYYRLNELFHSPWIEEIRRANSVHPRHSDEMYNNKRHFIIPLKDVTIEIIANDYREVQLSSEELLDMIKKQIEYIRP